MFIESRRLERDFFYDPGMQGVNYEKMLKMYLPLVSRIRDISELNDLIGQIVSELSALHTFFVGGYVRKESQQIGIGSLGAEIIKDIKDGGYKIKHIYKSDPDYVDDISLLLKQGSNVKEGDVILSINGVSTLSVPSPNVLLENHTGYVHLRAMGNGNFTEWVKQFYPVFNREGLIIDVRHNRGGNIDSWILEKLLRKAWMYWKCRVGVPSWNMQYAFRGHLVVLCDAFTASDGEAFTEGFRRLGLGKVIGTRTWGGEIWLSFDNWLVDHGIASAAEVPG